MTDMDKYKKLCDLRFVKVLSDICRGYLLIIV